jgi:hypothetical protein
MPVATWNATQTSLTNSIDAGPLLMIVILVISVVVLVAVLTSLERYTKLFETIEKWIATLKYTAFGVGITAAGYGLYISCKMIASAGSGIDPLWIAEAIGVYAVLTLLGWCGSKIVGKIKTMHTAYIESKKSTIS